MPANPASATALTASSTSVHFASNGSRRRSTSTGSTPGNRVPRFDLADLVHSELPCGHPLAHSSTRGEHEADVIAGVDALDDRPGEPVPRREHGTPVRARLPFDVLELVGFVAGLGTEEVRQVVVTLAEQVDHEGRRRQRDAVRPVLLRQPDSEARGIDAALRRKGDEAAVALACCCGRHHVRRTIQVGDDGVEGVRFSAHFLLIPPGLRPSPGPVSHHAGVEIISFASGRACPQIQSKGDRWLIRWTALGSTATGHVTTSTRSRKSSMLSSTTPTGSGTTSKASGESMSTGSRLSGRLALSGRRSSATVSTTPQRLSTISPTSSRSSTPARCDLTSLATATFRSTGRRESSGTTSRSCGTSDRTRWHPWNDCSRTTDATVPTTTHS